MAADRDYKAVVIGSGAGGAPAAAALAEAWGDGVAILEAGRHMRARDFTQRERDMLPALYAGGGARATEDGSVGFLGGQVVGGSTVINDALCFRPPPEISERWAAYGVDLPEGALDPYVDAVEAQLRVEQIPQSHINRSNYLVALGAARLGWRVERLRHNSPSCSQCGFRHLGCAYDAKQSMNLTYVPLAQVRGAALHAETRATRLKRVGDRWEIETDGGLFRAETVVIAAGVVETPALLLRSGFAAGGGVQPHLQAVAWGDFDDPVDGHNGIPMAVGVLEHGDVYGQTGPGYLIEGVGYQPGAFAATSQLMGREHDNALERYTYLAGALQLLRSRGRGKISLGPGGRANIDWPLVEADAVRVSDFYRRVTELFLAAGATRVLLAHRTVRQVTAPPTDVPVSPGLQYLYTAHPFGGACRGDVLDGEGRVKAADGLWVLDASAFPEALGVNPQITIASLSLQGADRILNK